MSKGIIIHAGVHSETREKGQEMQEEWEKQRNVHMSNPSQQQRRLPNHVQSEMCSSCCISRKLMAKVW